jgi:hypothetical protein
MVTVPTSTMPSGGRGRPLRRTAGSEKCFSAMIKPRLFEQLSGSANQHQPSLLKLFRGDMSSSGSAPHRPVPLRDLALTPGLRVHSQSLSNPGLCRR